MRGFNILTYRLVPRDYIQSCTCVVVGSIKISHTLPAPAIPVAWHVRLNLLTVIG